MQSRYATPRFSEQTIELSGLSTSACLCTVHLYNLLRSSLGLAAHQGSCYCGGLCIQG